MNKCLAPESQYATFLMINQNNSLLNYCQYNLIKYNNY